MIVVSVPTRSSQLNMGKVDGWQTFATKPIDQQNLHRPWLVG
jgi:hypothetical protein